MAKLNCKTDKTKKIIHLMVTTLCNRNCKYCCNKQYDLNDIPYVTDEELKEAETLCITGGEPFLFSEPCHISAYYKKKYPNIKQIYVYTNATELAEFLKTYDVKHIDGLSISIKTKEDADIFDSLILNEKSVLELQSNRLYVFDNLYNSNPKGFKVIHREWQENFNAADDSIFRKM